MRDLRRILNGSKKVKISEILVIGSITFKNRMHEQTFILVTVASFSPSLSNVITNWQSQHLFSNSRKSWQCNCMYF